MDGGDSDNEARDSDKLLSDQGSEKDKKQTFYKKDEDSFNQSRSRHFIASNKRCLIAGGILACVVILAIIIGSIAKSQSHVNDCDSVGQSMNGNNHSKLYLASIATNGEIFPYRNPKLPTHLYPTEYNITLIPNLKQFSYLGIVTVTIRIKQPKDYIILHQRQLNITTIAVKCMNITFYKPLHVTKTLQNTYNEYLYIKLNDTLRRDHVYILTIRFSGQIATDKMIGVYRSIYNKADGQERVTVSTDFEPADARSAFPCFDEPTLKAVFRLSIYYPSGDGWLALSNMPASAVNHVGNGYVKAIFQPSPVMSTYLVAFVLCQFKSKQSYTNSGIKVRTWSVPDEIDKTQHALNTAVKALQKYEDYFNISYPLPKLDIVGVPFFSSSAMENWGLLLFKETALFYSKTTSTTSDYAGVTTTVCHEISHQWFGNLVTLKWWNNLWLNEGFAAYMEVIGADHAAPELRMMHQFPMMSTSRAMAKDALKGARPISVKVETVKEIGAMFNPISYDKGASLLHMLHNFLKDTFFQNGIHYYLNTHKYASADDTDLWKAFTKATHESFDVASMMNTWTKQAGFPLITITSSSMRLHIKQRRFIIDPTVNKNITYHSHMGSMWHLNINVVMYNGATSITKSTMLKKRNGTIQKPNGSFKWYKGNVNQTGYYRVNYDRNNWKNLQQQLASDHQKINTLDRFGLLDDSFALSRAGLLPASTFLSLTWYIDKEIEFLPVSSAIEGLLYIHSLLTDESDRKHMQIYILKKLQPIFDHVGWVDDGSPLTKSLRLMVISVLCSFKQHNVVDKAKDLFREWLYRNKKQPPNLKYMTISCGVANGNEEDWQMLLSKYHKSNSPITKSKYLGALSKSKDPKLLQQLLETSLNEHIISPGETVTVIASVASNPLGSDLAWDFATKNWKLLTDRYAAATFQMDHLILGITSNFHTKEELEKVQKFFQCHKNIKLPVVSEAIEKIKAKIQWSQLHDKEVSDWIKFAIKTDQSHKT